MVNSYFRQDGSLLDWSKTASLSVIKPWKPRALAKAEWPPDYRAVYAWRIEQLQKLRNDPALLASAKAYYRLHNNEFITHWMDTYNPRLDGSKWIPFVHFKRQDEFIQFLNECVRDQEDGLDEKARDMGATWDACGWSVHKWLFEPDFAIGWGSRKEDLVDTIGDVQSIFEKMRMLVRRLPDIWKPPGFSEKKYFSYMKMVNHDNGSTIIGESGDNIGRGGRTSTTFVDEHAHCERQELIEAALGDNTNVIIRISSVNGLGNVFYRKRQAGVVWRPDGMVTPPGYTRVFIHDWHDHPEKTQEWYDLRKAKYEREGLQHLFAQEVDRNYSAAISNTIIPMEWLRACVDAHKYIKWKDQNGVIHTGIPDAMIPNNWTMGLDVADGGIDRNGMTLRQWIIWRDAQEWGERDPGITARRAVFKCQEIRRAGGLINCQYDEIGVGSGVKTEYNRLSIDIDDATQKPLINPFEIPFVGWNAGGKVIDPEYRIIPDDEQSALNKDFFKNMKAQAWWSIRTRVYKTWNNIKNGVIYSVDDLISFDSRMALLQQVLEELAQPVSKPDSNLRMIVDKMPDGMKSPNLADGGVMMYFPVEANHTVIVGRYG